MDKVSPNDSVFNPVIDQYNKVVVDFDSSLIRKNLTEEFKTKGDYVGREIYELLQNAEDQKSTYVKITLDDQFVSVENGGPECVPFSKKGFISIMMADMSPKFEDGAKQYIGCKGLGFRSILNWSKSIEICSNGVRCKFSREIADNCWEDIKQHIIENIKDKEKAAQVILKHESFAKRNYGFRTPVPTLAKPITDDYDGPIDSTVIRVEYDMSDSRVVNSINEQIKSISGTILIFLTHIKRIEIQDKVHGNSQVITCTHEPLSEGVEQYHIMTEGQDTTVFYVLKRDGATDKNKYEVSIAYCPDRKVSGEYVYSFFPTRMRLGLPCVVHATFDLNSSRNALKDNSPENDTLMDFLASSLMDFSCWVAKHRASKGIYDWDAYSILSLNEFDKKDFPILDSQINAKLSELSIIPTIGRLYSPAKDVEYYGEEFSSLFNDLTVHLNQCSALFARHVIPGMPGQLESFIKQATAYDDTFVERINLLSEEMLSLREHEIVYRIRLINSLIQLSCGRMFKLLVAKEDHQLCDKPCLYVGRSLPQPPEELRNTYIDDELLNAIYDSFGSRDPETIRKRLSLITEITRSDVTDLKEKIIAFTKENRNIDKFKELIRSFFLGISDESNSITNVIEEISGKLLFFDSSGRERHHPYEMVLDEASSSRFNDYQPEWIMYQSLEEWADYLQTDIKTARDFFIHTLGLSCSVPKDYISFGHDDDYLRQYSEQYRSDEPPWPYTFHSERILSYQSDIKTANYAYVIKTDFLDYLARRCNNCNVFLNQVFGDPGCKLAVSNRYIYYQYRSLHSEVASCSYLEYKLREHPFLAPLSTYIVSDNLNLLAGEKYSFEALPELSEQETKQILLNLGAKSSLSDLTKDELYSILYQIPDSCPPKGVSDVYKKIREALLKYRSECAQDALEFHNKGRVYARLGGVVSIWPVSEVYYWDNDQLPQKVLSTKPKFEIGNRVGEESVKAIFGVSLAKEIAIEEVPGKSCPNQIMTSLVNAYFKRRIKYILSYCHDNQARFKELFIEPLKDITFNIYSSFHYLLDGAEYDLSDGEMVTRPDKERVYHICSTASGITNDCIDDPKLCEAIVESICITLKITGSEKIGYFRNIISSSISKNDYIWKRDGVFEKWSDIEKAMGLSEKERGYWEIISKMTGKEIDFSRLSLGFREKRAYLSELYPNIDFEALFDKSFPEFDDMDMDKKYSLAIGLKQYGFDDISAFGDDGFYEYYAKTLNEIKNTYGEAYKTNRFRLLNANKELTRDDVYAFYDSCQGFLGSLSWTSDLAKDNKKQLLSPDQLDDLVSKYLEKKYGFSNRNDIDEIKPLETYAAIMSEAGVIESDFEQKDLVLSYFRGFEPVFKEKADAILRQRNADSLSANSDDSRGAVAASFSYGHGIPIETGIQKVNHSGSGGGSFNSRPANLYRNGKNAEWLVYNALCARKDEFIKVIPNSRILDSLIGSDNNGKHCDILYYKKNKPNEERYLEVKSLKGSAIFLSDDEYLFASEHKETYDIAVVKDNSVTIIEHPFLDEEDKPSLKVRPDVYRIDLKVESNLGESTGDE